MTPQSLQIGAERRVSDSPRLWRAPGFFGRRE
jgi:hypothetical protein